MGLGISGNVRGTMRYQCVALCVFPLMALPSHVAAQTITVVDGDTVERGGERWRIVGIDAPEIHGARCQAERERGIIVAARLIALLRERAGRLIETGRDKYGRRLGRLVIGWPSTGETVWADLAVAEGLAVAWDGKGARHDWCGQSAPVNARR
jgi:micrococcal nuclease